MQATAPAAVPSPSVKVEPRVVDWMANLAWCRARRQQLLDTLGREAAQPLSRPTDHGVHKTRVDALAIFDRRIAELEACRIP